MDPRDGQRSGSPGRQASRLAARGAACGRQAHVSLFFSMPSWWMPLSWAKALAPTMACNRGR
jgi:hypothetical protein